jgi:hypothetical protein
MKMREQQAIVQVKTDPHWPGEFRANGTLRNQPGFYEAFKVMPGDKMYLAPKDPVHHLVWAFTGTRPEPRAWVFYVHEVLLKSQNVRIHHYLLRGIWSNGYSSRLQ